MKQTLSFKRKCVAAWLFCAACVSHDAVVASASGPLRLGLSRQMEPSEAADSGKKGRSSKGPYVAAARAFAMQPLRLLAESELMQRADPTTGAAQDTFALDATGQRRHHAANAAAKDDANAGRPAVQNPQALRLLPDDRFVLDGRVDEPFWSRVQPMDRFFQIDPFESDQPPTRTEARFALDAENLYVAITAYDPDPSLLVAPLSRRDDLAFNQDRVTVYIDSLGERRSALFFEVNPAGVVVDGTFDELTGADDTDLDTRFRAKSSRFAQGWMVEMAIPLTSLAYHPDAEKPWTVLVARFFPRDEFYYLATGPLPANCTLCVASELRAIQSLPAYPTLQGVTHMEYRRRVDRASDGSTDAKSRVRWGLQASLRPSSETVLGLAVRPDAARYEIDEPLLDADQADRADLKEKRPFFVEPGDILKSPLNLLQTRTVLMPQAALSLSHREPDWDATALLVRDAGGDGLLEPAGRGSDADGQGSQADVTILRSRLNVGPGRLGALLSHRKGKTLRDENTVVALDGSVRLDTDDLVQMQWARSWFKPTATEPLPAMERDSAALGSWSHDGDRMKADVSWQKVGTEFRADVGYVDGVDEERHLAEIELKETLPWEDTGPLLKLERSQSLSTSVRERHIGWGLYADLPKDTRLEWYPWYTTRRSGVSEDSTQVLRQHRFKLSTTPVAWVTELNLEVSWGDALYKPFEQVGSGLHWSSALGLQPRDDLQLRWNSEFQRIRSAGANLGREATNQWLVLWMMSADSHLRGLLRKRSVRTAAESGNQSKETAYTLSYQKLATAGFQLDMGVTLRRMLSTNIEGSSRSEQMEWFSAIQWPFQ